MKAKTNRKGFTITELVIVIVVVAVLAAVLIPGFTSVITKAEQSVDTQLVRSINVILEAEAAAKTDLETTDQVKQTLVDNGINDISLQSEGYVLYWVAEDHCVVLYDTEAAEAVYPAEYVGADISAWALLDDLDLTPTEDPTETDGGVLVDILNQQNAAVTSYLALPGYDGVYTSSKVGSKTLQSILPNVRNFTDLPDEAKSAVVTDLESGQVFYTLAVAENACTVHSLIPNRTYSVEFRDAAGEPVSFTEDGVTYTHAELAVAGQVRLIYTEYAQSKKDQGSANGMAFRDLGGWQVAGGGRIKYGMIYRSARTELLADSEADVDFIKNKLGIRHVYDLRATEEYAPEDYRVDGLGMGEGYYHALESGGSMHWYHGCLENPAVHKPIFQTIFDTVAAGEPILFHCRFGTDRTGTLAFMIEALLGASNDDLVRDFELTVLCSHDGASNVTKNEFQLFIDKLNTYDGTTYAEKAYHWFLAAGFSEQELNAFRGNMIEGGSAVTYGEVTYELVNVTSSNSAKVVSSKADFTTTLTPVEGYDVSGMTVTVAVGGVNKTEEFYNAETHTVTIPKASITGDVKIIATVTKAAGLNTNFDEDAFVLTGNPPVRGETYSAKLTTKGAWLITEVTVTMGGTEILNESLLAYEKDIEIANVTGDITVTVEGIENQVRNAVSYGGTGTYGTNGYAVDRGLSSDSYDGYYAKPATGYVATGFIEFACAGDSVIYIKGGELDSTDYTRLYFCKTNKDNSSAQGFSTIGTIDDYFTITNENGWLKLTAKGTDKLSAKNVIGTTYMRISLKCTDGADLIITFEDPT